MVTIKELGKHVIVYDPEGMRFVLKERGGTIVLATALSQVELEKKAEALSRADFKRRPVLQIARYGGGDAIIESGQITSFDGHAGWVSWEKGGRRKVERYDFEHIYPDTPSIRGALQQVIDKMNQADAINREASELRGRLSHITVEMLREQA